MFSNSIDLVSMRPRRMLLLNWRDPQNPRAGGAEIHMWELFKRAAAKGWDITLLCCSFPGAKPDEIVDGIRIVRIGGEFTFYALWVGAFIKVVRENQPEIIFEFMNKLPFFSPMLTRRPTACYVHHLFGDAAHHEFPRILAWVVRATESLVPFVYRNVPFLTGARSTILELECLGISRARLKYAPYGVDIEQFHPAEKAVVPTILFVGRIKKYKGISDMLSAVKFIREDVPDLRVDIVGDGDARASLETQARGLGLDRLVTFHGFVSEERKVALYQNAWVACLPSAKEGFGLTIPEAALCETPTVGYDVPGVRDAVVDGKTGLLVPYGNIAELGSAILRVITNRFMRAQLASAAREHYRQFTWDRSTDETLAIVASILDSKALSRANVFEHEVYDHKESHARIP